MPNELLIILSFLTIYRGVVLFYRFFGKGGLLAFNIVATLLAFYGTYPIETLVSIFTSSYLIYIVTSLLDTPFVYWCRHIHDKHYATAGDTEAADA